jgi:hypothetical protein
MKTRTIGMAATTALTTLVVSGCITTDVRSVEERKIPEICIHKNAKVRDGFLTNLEEEIQKKGISTRIYEVNSPPADCSYTMEYTANWNWDIAMYLSYAKIDLYKDGAQVGSAEYDARMAGLMLNKFKGAESKVDPLLDELFANVE